MGIERYRAIVRLEEIRALTETGEYEAAKEIADTIKKERLKDSGDLFLLATVYRKCGEFGTAKEFLLRIGLQGIRFNNSTLYSLQRKFIGAYEVLDLPHIQQIFCYIPFS